ncbi:Kunitz/Bovine pancreatic trypsin inhibitor domain protein, partial [Ostertagia ostertagi]
SELRRSLPDTTAACCQLQQLSEAVPTVYRHFFIPRYYYFDALSHRCRPFLYPGTVDPCTLDQESGVGSVQLIRFYFNKQLKLCEEFIYFGAGGNRNNFLTMEECQAQCPGGDDFACVREESPNPCAVTVTIPGGQCTPGVSSCGGGSFCHVGATPQTTTCCPKPAPIDRCQQPLNVGIGNANLQRWYFNPLTQQCQPCTYRGLQGNENNFLTKIECETSCLGWFAFHH